MAISVIDGFSLKAKKHIDERFSFATKDEMTSFDANALAVGLISYCEEDKKTYQWSGDEWKALSAGNESGALWEDTNATVMAVGGLKAGTTLDGKSALEIIDMMVNPYQAPVIAISINPATTLYEVGQSPSITITANLTKKTNEITAAKILKDGADLKVAIEGELQAKTFSQSAVQITADTAFSSKVSDAQGEVNGNSINVRFTRKSYYGLIGAAESVTTDTQIEALGQNQLTGSKGLTWASYNANNQKVVYAYPKSFGDLTSIKDGNNFEMLGSFTKTTVQRDGVDYNVYTLTNPMSITGGKLVFA